VTGAARTGLARRGAASFLAALGALAVGCASGERAAEPSRPAPPRIDRERVAVVLIDAQPGFWREMAGAEEPVLARIEQLLGLAWVAEMPTIATFEHPTESNGWLPERLEKVFPAHGQRFVKRTFDCCREPEIRAALEALAGRGIDQVVLAGAETDVCVLQSALGLIELGFEVFLLEDCIFSNEANVAPAFARLRAAGAVPTTYKTFHYEVTRSVDRNATPSSWRERREALGIPRRSPYDLPPSEQRE
jgi:nicotinamidase-related amidase